MALTALVRWLSVVASRASSMRRCGTCEGRGPMVSWGSRGGQIDPARGSVSRRRSLRRYRGGHRIVMCWELRWETWRAASIWVRASVTACA